MIFGALSNAVYRVSLRDPGAEIEGGLSRAPPPSGGGKSRGPSGSGLNFRSKFTGEPGAGYVVGWWVRGVTQQARLSGLPGPTPPTQPFGLNL